MVESFRPDAGHWFSAVTVQASDNPWTEFADEFAQLLERRALRGVVAISGGQGSGKSTLANAVVHALEGLGRHAVACSIDDFYHTAASRQALARSLHPLFATRGVPGTHDIDLCQATLDALLEPGEVALPAFDKGADDRVDASAWRRVEGPMDVVILEGWCLGARAQADDDLLTPINELERLEDTDGRWRRAVNDALVGPYHTLFARFAYLLYLKVPDLDAVRRWRNDQEQGLPTANRMSADQITRFIQHYERLTRWMTQDVPEIADLTLDLGEDHHIVSRSVR